MNVRRLAWTLTAALAFSGSALAQGKMGMGMHGMMMGEGDQKVSKEEFLKHAEARFARMDVNKDGVIDATDRAAMRKRMQDCMGMMDGGMGGMGGDMQGGAAGSAGQDKAQSPKP